MENSNENSMNAQTENVTNEVKNDNTQKPASGKKGEDKKTPKKKREESEFNLTCARYRKTLKQEKRYKCLSDGKDVHQYSLNKALAMSKDANYNRYVFLKDVYPRINLLLDHTPFKKLCQITGFDAYSVATHVVMLGSSKLKAILMDDIINTGNIRLAIQKDWKKPLFNREELGLTDQQTCEAA